MKMYHNLYFLSVLIFICAIVGFFITASPMDRTSLNDPKEEWENNEVYYQTYIEGDKLFFYTKNTSISSVDITNFTPYTRVRVNTNQTNGFYTLRFTNEVDIDNHPEVNILYDGNTPVYGSYILLFEVTFQEGLHTISFEVTEDFYPAIISTKTPIVPYIVSYEEYYMIPYLMCFLGLFIFTIAHFSRRNTLEHDTDPHRYGEYRPKRQKREKY
jgi:hypothetical protein